MTRAQSSLGHGLRTGRRETRTNSRVRTLVRCAFVGLAVAAPAAGEEIFSTFSSGIYADGTTTPGFFNYYTGYSIPSTPIERRTYFIFDLTSATIPIASAKLKLFLPGGPGMVPGFISSDPTEDYRLSGSPFPWEAYAGAFGGSASPALLSAMFPTMGSGPAYGLMTISVDAAGTDIEFELSSTALEDLNASLGSMYLITGRLADIHPDAPGMPPSELVFAYTDIPDPLIPFPRLELTLVPAPGACAPLAVAGVVLSIRRQRRNASHFRSSNSCQRA